MATSTAVPWSRVRRAGSKFTTPLHPDDYLRLLNPLWTSRELRGRVEKVVPETDDAATLVYLANQATVEFHAALSTVDDLEHPDRLVIDIDPPPGVATAVLHAVARAARDLYVELGLTPFVQATGGRGYHVVAPLDRSADFEAARALGRIRPLTEMAATSGVRPLPMSALTYAIPGQARVAMTRTLLPTSDDGSSSTHALPAVPPWSVNFRTVP